MNSGNKNPSVSIDQAAKLTGLSVHMITYLGRLDILKPSIRGRGRRRLFSFNDVLFLKVVADLLSRGIEVKRLRNSLVQAKKEAERWVSIREAPKRYLVTDGTELFVRSYGRLESKTRNGQFAFSFVMDLGTAHRSLSSSWPEGVATPNRRLSHPRR